MELSRSFARSATKRLFRGLANHVFSLKQFPGSHGDSHVKLVALIEGFPEGTSTTYSQQNQALHLRGSRSAPGNTSEKLHREDSEAHEGGLQCLRWLGAEAFVGCCSQFLSRRLRLFSR